MNEPGFRMSSLESVGIPLYPITTRGAGSDDDVTVGSLIHLSLRTIKNFHLRKVVRKLQVLVQS